MTPHINIFKPIHFYENYSSPSSYITYHRVCDNSDTTGATYGTETACHSSVSEFTPAYSKVVIPLCPSSPPAIVRFMLLDS